MRLTSLPIATPRQLNFLAEHRRGASRLILEFWLGRPAGFCHRFAAWDLSEDGQRSSETVSDEFIPKPGADIEAVLLARLPELLEIRPLSNHERLELSSILADITAFERSLQPRFNPLAV